MLSFYKPAVDNLRTFHTNATKRQSQLRSNELICDAVIFDCSWKLPDAVKTKTYKTPVAIIVNCFARKLNILNVPLLYPYKIESNTCAFGKISKKMFSNGIAYFWWSNCNARKYFAHSKLCDIQSANLKKKFLSLLRSHSLAFYKEYQSGTWSLNYIPISFFLFRSVYQFSFHSNNLIQLPIHFTIPRSQCVNKRK